MCVILSGPLGGPPGMYWASVCRFEETLKHLGAVRANSKACWALFSHIGACCTYEEIARLRGTSAELTRKTRKMHDACIAVFPPFGRPALQNRVLSPFGPPAPGSRKGENPKNRQKTRKHQCMLPLWALLGSLLEASWGVLEASWAVLGLSWASWGDLCASRGPLGRY